jgi:hypothetical protein
LQIMGGLPWEKTHEEGLKTEEREKMYRNQIQCSV